MNCLAPPPPPDGPQDTDFWDALVTPFQSNDFAAAIGKGVGDSIRRQQAPQPVTVHPVMPSTPAPECNIAANHAPPPPVPPAAVELSRPPPSGSEGPCKTVDGPQDDQVRTQAVVNALTNLYAAPEWREFLNALSAFICVNENAARPNLKHPASGDRADVHI